MTRWAKALVAMFLLTAVASLVPRMDVLRHVSTAWTVLYVAMAIMILARAVEAVRRRVADSVPMGLTRAFLYAGTRSVAVSLWKVADESTSELTFRFSRRLKSDPEHKAEALRRAQLELIEGGRFAHPFCWAPFVLVGQP